MDRRLVPLLTLVLTVCTPLADSAGGPSSYPSPSPASPVVAGPGACPATAPVTDERPKNINTASFGRGWYVSPDRLLWASASGPFYVGSNKVLWERPGSVVTISGKLQGGDAKTAGAPTITGEATRLSSESSEISTTCGLPNCSNARRAASVPR